MGSSQLNSILDAATKGDTFFLREAYRDNVEDLQSYFLGCEDTEWKNLLHAAIESDNYSFLYEALDILSLHPTLVIDLLCQPEGGNGCNPFHIAASGGNIFTVKLLFNAYARAVAADGNNQETPPWLKKDFYSNTPLRRSFFTERRSNEVIARYLVSQDQNLLRTMGNRYPMDQCSTLTLDDQQTSIVFNCMKTGCSQLVEQILTSDLPYSVNGNKSRKSPLHYASRCNEQVSRLLLKKHPELIGKVSRSGKTVLDRAVKDGTTWLVKLMIIEDDGDKYTIGYQPPPWIKACRRLIWHKCRDDTPLHMAARNGNMEIAQLVIQAYNSAIEDEASEWNGSESQPDDNGLLGTNPLFINNSSWDMPLVVALKNKHDDCGVMLSKETFPLTANYVVSGQHWKALLAAVNYGCRLSVKTILAIIVTPGSTKSVIAFEGHVILAPDVLKIFSYLFKKYQAMSAMLTSEEMEKLSEVLPEFLKEEVTDGKTLLKEAAERGEDWLVRLFLESDQDLIKESAPAWQVACEKGYISTLFTFIDKFGHQEFVNLCQDSKQTPLHHIRLEEYGQYIDLLEMPVMEVLKNQIDCDGATPLHRAIQRYDLDLTEALLQTQGIDVTIKDKNGTTAFDLLENNCMVEEVWREEYIKLLTMPGLEVLKNLIGSDGATPLHRAIQRNDHKVIKALLETKDIDVSIEDRNGTTAFDLLEIQGKFSYIWFDQYMELLERPAIEVLINKIDSDGSTLLHRAIQCDDFQLTKKLLEIKVIEVSIKNKNGKSALDLLEKRCKFSNSWGKMCREVEQDSTVQKLKYLFRKISFEGMQNTLSLVAALVATITYAAGFNVPGGSDNNDGTPMLATKAAFLAFSISNTIAMCSSIMVLFLLLGPMMWDPQPSLFYVNLSLFLLRLSLGGTLLAFMTGVYVTMVPKAEWNAIFVIVSCSLTLFVACIVLLFSCSPRLKNLVLQSFHWLKKVDKSNPPPTPSQQGQLSGNTIMQRDQSPSISATSSTAPVSPQSDSQNTLQLSAGPSDIQLPANVLPSDQQSGSTNTAVTQPSGIPLTTAPELGQHAHNPNWDAGQSSGTSPMAPNDTKIDITST